LIVCIADDIFEKGALLDLDRAEFPFGLAEEIEVAIDSLKSEVDRFGTFVFYEMVFVEK
jgi:hypothetical protein